MSEYFSYFPAIKYEGVAVRDITRRTNFVKDTLANPLVFLPYTIPEGMKPEDVSYNYYGSVAYTWLVLQANGMQDPYTDWPMDTLMFNEYLIAKYAELSGEKFYDVIAWISSFQNDENILFYYREMPSGEVIQVGPETFNTVDAALIEDFIPMRIFDYEMMLNESKRNIQLVDYEYRNSVVSQFGTLIVK